MSPTSAGDIPVVAHVQCLQRLLLCDVWTDFLNVADLQDSVMQALSLACSDASADAGVVLLTEDRQVMPGLAAISLQLLKSSGFDLLRVAQKFGLLEAGGHWCCGPYKYAYSMRRCCSWQGRGSLAE